MPTNWVIFAIFALIGFIVGWGLQFFMDMIFWQRNDRRTRHGGGGITGRMPSASGQAARQKNRSMDEALAERDAALLQARRELDEREKAFASLDLKARDYESTFNHLSEQVKQQSAEIQRLRSTLPEDEIASLNIQISTLSAQFNSSENARRALAEQAERNEQDLRRVNTHLTGQVQSLQAELQRVRQVALQYEGTVVQLQDEHEVYEAETRRISRELHQASEELEYFQQRDRDKLVIEETEYIHEDDMTDIKGIGDVYGEKLREAGFYTFNHLAETDAEEIQRLLDIPAWRAANIQNWIEQARQLAEQKDSEDA